jgi:hypothetical protein
LGLGVLRHTQTTGRYYDKAGSMISGRWIDRSALGIVEGDACGIASRGGARSSRWLAAGFVDT